MIIGITGTLGAGKGTVAEYLVKKHNFTYLSVRNYITAEIVRRGKLVNRDSMVSIATEIRKEKGASWPVNEILDETEQQLKALKQHNVVIESIRTVGEAKLLKSKGALLWAADADIETRYKRVVKRASVTDGITFERFKADEEREMHGADENSQNLAAVRNLADLVILNNGTQEELYQQVEAALAKSGVR